MVWLPALFDFDAKNGWQDSRVGRRLSRLRGVERQRRRHRDGGEVACVEPATLRHHQQADVE